MAVSRACIYGYMFADDSLRGRGIFLIFFVGMGLTKFDFGCILYDIGSEKSRCSLQNRRIGDEKRRAGLTRVRRIFRKIFGKWFDKAEKCAIVYITRLIPESVLRRAGSDH